MQHVLLKQSMPAVHCKFDGQAARHLNTIGSEYIITANENHAVEIYKRGSL